MSLNYQNISLSLKAFLSFLFGILLFGELIDGVFDINDCAVLSFFAIMVSDTYIHFKYIENGVNPPIETISKRLSTHENRERTMKAGMNFFFGFLLFLSIFVDGELIDVKTQNLFYKIMGCLWAISFFGVSLHNLKSSFNVKRLVFTNIALILFLGTVVYM